MIRFPCRCGKFIEVEASEAGGLAQCPKCGRLNDVPGLDDLGRVDADGGYKLADETDAPDGRTRADRTRQTVDAMRNGGRDAKGRSRDLRPSLDDFLKAGTTADGDQAADDLKPARPKYDPLTGELVRPLDLRRDAPLPVESVAGGGPAARRERGSKLTYANRKTGQPAVPPRRVPLELLMPQNVVVMAFACGTVLLPVVVLSVFPMQAAVFLALPMLVLALALVGHFGNVIDETGPNGRDELPTLLRNFSVADDIWTPGIQVLFSFLACFGPGLFTFAYVWRLARWQQAAPVDPRILQAFGWALLAGGAVLFPAVLLTATTAGAALVNLSPFRLLGTIRACGRDYWVALLVLLLAAATFGGGLFYTAVGGSLPASWHLNARVVEIATYLMGLPSLVVGVYLAHLFCWRLGLLYRMHHGHFPWAFQRFEGSRDDAMKRLEHRRAAARQARVEARVEALRNRPAKPKPAEPVAAIPVEPLED